MSSARHLSPLLAALLFAGCSTVDTPRDYGRPVRSITGRAAPTDIVSDEDEMDAAARQDIAIRAAQPPSPEDATDLRVLRLRRVFTNLVAVAHRSQLPWQVRLVPRVELGAFTAGGGYLYVDEGLLGSGGLVNPGDDDELATVLAHLVAHVVLRHTSSLEAWRARVGQPSTNPFYSQSFSPEQEREADRLAALYMALAGYNPRAAVRFWGRAVRWIGRGPAQFLRAHPVDPARMSAGAEDASDDLAYYTPGERARDWERIRDLHPLFAAALAEPVHTAAAPGANAPRAVPDAGTRPEPAPVRTPTSRPVPAPPVDPEPAVPVPPRPKRTAAIEPPRPSPQPAAEPERATAPPEVAAAPPPARAPTPPPASPAPPRPAPEPAVESAPELLSTPSGAGLRPVPPVKDKAAKAKGGVARALKAALDRRDQRDGQRPPPQADAGWRIVTPGRAGAPLPLVRFAEVRTSRDGDGEGYPVVDMRIENTGRREVSGLDIRIAYSSGTGVLAEDRSCQGPARIAPGESAWLRCDLQYVPGSVRYDIEITDVRFR